jgi:[acyl-carrier-protein] S-malonyltransferase
MWAQSIRNMISDGATSFTEVGPGKILQGLIKKINRDIVADGAVFQVQ